MPQFLYIGCNGYVAALDPSTGVEAWRVPLPAGSGQNVTVIEHEGALYVGVLGNVYGIDAATGEIVWHNGLEGMGYGDVTLSIDGKSVQFVAIRTSM